MKRIALASTFALLLSAAVGTDAFAAAEGFIQIDPFVAIVTGLKVDTIIQGEGESREGRVSAMMLSDFGLRGKIGDLVSFESELMANGGTSLHGASAWEGQAALQVRKQIVRLTYAPWVFQFPAQGHAASTAATTSGGQVVGGGVLFAMRVAGIARAPTSTRNRVACRMEASRDVTDHSDECAS